MAGLTAPAGTPDFEWLPPFAQESSVRDMAVATQEEGRAMGTEKRLTMFDVCGNLVHTAWKAFTVSVVSLFLFQVIVNLTSTCTESTVEGVEKHYVQSPEWLILLWCPVTIYVKRCEWKCFKSMSIPFVQWIGPFPSMVQKLMGNSFYVWAAYESYQTLVSSVAKPSQSIMIFQTFRTYYCDVGGDFPSFWGKTMTLIPFGDDDTIMGLVIISLLLMWVEALWYFLLTFTLEAVNYGPRTEPQGYEVLMSSMPWSCVVHPGTEAPGARFKIWHADAIQYLSEVAAMHSLRVGYMQYSLQRAIIAYRMDPGREVRSFQIIVMECSRAVPRFFFQTVQMCCALEVHITLFAFDGERVGGVQNLTFSAKLNLVLHFLSGLLLFLDSLASFNTLYEFRNLMLDMVQNQVGGTSNPKFEENSQKILRSLSVLFVGIVCYSWVLLDVFLKFAKQRF